MSEMRADKTKAASLSCLFSWSHLGEQIGITALQIENHEWQ